MKLQVEYAPIDTIKPYEKNPRYNDAAVDGVAKSIEQYGFRQPIVVDADGVIIAGHTRYKAAQKLGLKSVPIHKATDLSEKQVAAYWLADNKTGQKAIWDNKLLLGELDFIGYEFFTGFEVGKIYDVLDENYNESLEENTQGIEYVVTFKSADKAMIDKLIEVWGGFENG